MFCDDDVIASGMYLAARDRGVRIPEDLSVIGFDDMDFSRVLSPPLTTVALDADCSGPPRSSCWRYACRASGLAGGSCCPPSSWCAARRRRRARVRRVTIHVVGADGMLGQDIVRAAGGAAVALTDADLDVTDAAAARAALAAAR